MKTNSKKVNGYLATALLSLMLILLSSCGESPSDPPGFAGGLDSGANNSGSSCKAFISDVAIDNALQQAKEIRRNAEIKLHRLNDDIPGFGGMYINEGGRFVVFLKDEAKRELAKSIILQDVKENSYKSYTHGGVDFKFGEYSFRELAAWRELITAFMLANSEFEFVISNHVDEAQNRVVVGIDHQFYNDQHIAVAESFIESRLNIPVDAVIFEADYPVIEELDNSVQNLSGTIQDRQRPLVGGLRIRYGSDSRCTLGFLGLFEGEEVFVTNGHCSETPHILSNTLYYQGERNQADDLAGFEIMNGPQNHSACTISNSDCWPCRWSDSALVSIHDNVETERGFITKTIWKSEFWMADGSFEIDEDDPVFKITETEVDVMLGMTLQKVGGNSGWTSGEVTRTCYDSRRSSDQLILQCQHRARYASSGGGTSGSPVFIMLGSDDEGTKNHVGLAGIHWGSSNRDQSNGYTVFSPLSGVLEDFNGLHGLKRSSQ